MKRAFPWTTTLQSVLCGLLALVLGCPGNSDVGGATNVAGVAVRAVSTGSEQCEIPENQDALVARIVELVNQERTARGLQELTLDPVLSQIAEDYCCEMIERHFFSHTDPEGLGPGQRAINAGYVFLAIGENLAGGQSSPEQAVADWMASTEGHRENILAHQWQETGVGVRIGGDYGVYWVQVFGNPP